MDQQRICSILQDHGITFTVANSVVIADDVAFNRHTGKTEVTQKDMTDLTIQELKIWLGY